MLYYLFLFLLRLTRPFLISKRPSKIVRNESDLSYKQIWKERSRSRIPWIYRESDQPRSKLSRIYRKSNQLSPKLPWIYRKSNQPRSRFLWIYRESDQPRPRLPWIYRKSNQPRSRSPLTYSKLGWSSFRPLSGKLYYDFSATTTSKKPKKEAGTKVLASQLSLDCRTRRSGWVGSTRLISSAFTALLNCAEVGRRNRILTNYRFLSHSPILLL